MPENLRDELVFECKSEIQNHPQLTTMDDRTLLNLIEQKLDEKTRAACPKIIRSGLLPFFFELQRTSGNPEKHLRWHPGNGYLGPYHGG